MLIPSKNTVNNQDSEKIRLKREKAMLLLEKRSILWNNKLYCTYDFQVDSVIRNALGYLPRGLGKEPYEYIEL